MQVTIKKAAIKGSMFLYYEFEQKDGDIKNTIKTTSDAPIHEDLRNAFRNLIPHYAFICEEVKSKSLVKKAIQDPETYLLDKESAPDETFFKYRVFEFSLKEKKGGEEVLTIAGGKLLESRDEIYFTTPDVNTIDSEYEFLAELNESIATLVDEVLAYMQGKTAPKSQLDMFPEDEEEVMEESM